MSVILTINEHGPLKRDIIEAAFEDCGSAGYEFERSAEEVASALRKLNALMAEWKGRGVDLGFAQPTYGAGEPDEPSGIPYDAMNAVSSHLALRLSPQMGAELSRDARANMRASFIFVMGQYAAKPPKAPYAHNTPRGAGSYLDVVEPFINGTT